MICTKCGIGTLVNTGYGYLSCLICGRAYSFAETAKLANRTEKTTTISEKQDTIDPKSSYYDAGGISTMDVIKAKLTPEQFKGYLLGNQIKYSLRLNHKGDPERDAEKAANYSRLLVEHR